jgi:hypothetical protein
MSPELSPELIQALNANDHELEVVDPESNRVYVIVSKERWSEGSATSDDNLNADEMLAAAAAANSGPEGWDAPGMDVYDGPEYDDVPSDS